MTFAVIIVDIQNDFCAPDGKMAKSGQNLEWLKKTVDKIKDFLKVINKFHVPLYYIETVMNSKLGEYEKNKEKKSKICGICKKGTWGTRLYKLKPKKEDVIIEKPGYSAFFRTNLNSELKKKKIKDLIIVGTSTHICVEATIIDAYQLGYNIIVPKELVATRKEEESFHKMALTIINKQFGIVLPVDQVIKLLK